MNTANPTNPENYMELQGERLYCAYRTIREQLLNWGEDPIYTDSESSNDFSSYDNVEEDDLDDVDSL